MCPIFNQQIIKSTRDSFLISSPISLTRKLLSVLSTTLESILRIPTKSSSVPIINGTSISTYCVTPAKIRHQRTRFSTIFKQVANILLRQPIVELLPSRQRSAQTSTYDPTTVTKTIQTDSIIRRLSGNHRIPRLRDGLHISEEQLHNYAYVVLIT